MAISDVSGRAEPTAVYVTSNAVLLTTPDPSGAVVTTIPASRIIETRERAAGSLELEVAAEGVDERRVVVLDFRYFGETDGSTAQIEALLRSRQE